MIIGLATGAIVTQATGLRLGGVIVTPLLAVYSLYSFDALPMFLVSAVIAYYLVGIIRAHTLIHGRQLLLTSLGVGAITPVVFSIIITTWSPGTPEMAFFGSILPGITAYNYHKLEPEERWSDVVLSCGLVTSLIVFGAAIVNPTVATELGSGMTSVLFSSGSDIAAFRGAIQGAPAAESVISKMWMLILLGLGLLASEMSRSRWGVRLGGLIAIPILVTLSLANAWTVIMYLLVLAVSFASITAINRLTLIYGRALLSIGLISSMMCGILVAATTAIISGFTLFFVVLLSGVGAYNFHRVAPAERLESLGLSAGLFGSLLVGTRLFIDPTADGLLNDPSVLEVSAIISVLILAAYCIWTLEQRRVTVAKYHARGVNI
ncbi:poly-gamma-glutamate biosynthesis protein PgsC/CapC [Natrialba sp. PRR66]|uniref:poly-gamma-glutamate biosynthesis protein PgsC/CapC n=1 Tax=Natrialba sp. PRR66 TaxID=3098146 RepID=UPI002B1DEE38|nr:poly-gamma-glutamate biosynthesis protein PgsC/CapC [Natrialba sp. PRR66]